MKNARADLAGVPLAPTRRVVRDYFALTKPRLNALVVVTSAAGYYLGAEPGLPIVPMLQAVVGTALVAGGAAVLNQLSERASDALMRRTRFRQLPDGRVTPAEARVLGLALSAAGIGLLLLLDLLAATLAVVTLVVYVAVYTPLKRRSWFAMIIGAIPGALPPLIGWTAARGAVTIGGIALFLIVFLWQIPHFLAIAWMFRDDYGKAGFAMLPVIEPEGWRTGAYAVAFAVALLPVSLLPTFFGIAGVGYYWVAMILGVALLLLSARFAHLRNDSSARTLFYASIAYLPLVLAAMIMDH